tara:strand:+ start:228 stop:614 length:387 start_codon:yes stop_codon:yes gene_type:complete
MTKSKFVIDKLAKLFEQGLISYKDLSSEIVNILKSKRDEIVFKMKLTSKEETDILIKRVESLEKKLEKLEKKKIKKKNYKGKKTLTLKPLRGDFSNTIFPPCDFKISDVMDNPRPTLDLESPLLLSSL